MLLVNKDRNCVYDLRLLENIYVGADGCTVKICTEDGNTVGSLLGRYNSRAEADTAFQIMLGELSRSDVKIVYMPQDKDVDAHLSYGASQHHLNGGRKPLRHGGS